MHQPLSGDSSKKTNTGVEKQDENESSELKQTKRDNPKTESGPHVRIIAVGKHSSMMKNCDVVTNL